MPENLRGDFFDSHCRCVTVYWCIQTGVLVLLFTFLLLLFLLLYVFLLFYGLVPEIKMDWLID